MNLLNSSTLLAFTIDRGEDGCTYFTVCKKQTNKKQVQDNLSGLMYRVSNKVAARRMTIKDT